jgi:molybdenum cofactor synthesis domain-containing protein
LGAIVTRRAAVIVSSTRAANGSYEDRTGPVIVDWLVERGFATSDAHVVADGPAVENALTAAIAEGNDLVITTGGTGIGAGDMTADATAALLTQPLPGIAEELRRRGALVTSRALLSRGVAGIAGTTFVINFPGSTGGVQDGLVLLGEIVDHVLDQVAGGQHD